MPITAHLVVYAFLFSLGAVACAAESSEDVENGGDAFSLGSRGGAAKYTCDGGFRTCSNGKWIRGIGSDSAVGGPCYIDGKPYPSGVQTFEDEMKNRASDSSPSAKAGRCEGVTPSGCSAKKWETCSGGRWEPELSASAAEDGECTYQKKAYKPGAQKMWLPQSGPSDRFADWVEPAGACE